MDQLLGLRSEEMEVRSGHCQGTGSAPLYLLPFLGNVLVRANMASDGFSREEAAVVPLPHLPVWVSL